MMNKIEKNFNLHSYLIPSIEKPINYCFNKATLARVSQVALPFLNLYQPFSVFIAVGSGSLQTLSHLKGLVEEIKKGNFKGGCAESWQLGLAIGSIAAAIFQSRVILICTASYEVSLDVQHLSSCLWNGKFDLETAGAFFQTFRHVVHLVSVIDPTPQTIIISLAVQIIFESYEAIGEFRQGNSHILDGVAKVILISLHGYQLHSNVRSLRALNKPIPDEVETPKTPTIEEPEFSQETLQAILADIQEYKNLNPNKKADFSFFLNKQGISNELFKADFTKLIANNQGDSNWTTDILKGVDFSHLTLTNCVFEGLNLQNCQFNGAIKGCNLKKCQLQGASFRQCDIQGTNFQYANLSSSLFSNSNVSESDFKYASLQNASLFTTHFDQSFFKQVNAMKAKFFGCSLKNCNLENAVFREAQFNQTSFSGVIANQANFIQGHFKNCSINNSSFLNGLFKKSRFTLIVATETDFSDATFNYSLWNQVTLDQSSLDYVSFHDACLSSVKINQGTLLGTSFFDCLVKNSEMKFCDLTDCLLFEASTSFTFNKCTENIITRPVIGLPWNLEVPGFTVPKVYRSLKAFQGIPLRFDYLPDDINTTKLDAQVKSGIAVISQNPPIDMLSIPDELLNRADKHSEIRRLQKRAERLLDNVSAIVLPGGNNVEGEFYGGERVATPSAYDPDYRRSVTEFALLKKAVSNKIPIIAICRGFQLSNVFFGGTLKNVEGHWSKIQKYIVEDGMIQSLVGRVMEGLSTHNQALEEIASVFNVVIKYEGVPKAAEAIGLNFLGFQFHPEWVLDNKDISKENGEIFAHHIEEAKKFKKDRSPQIMAA